MPDPGVPLPSNGRVSEGGLEADGAFNPFCLLDVAHLDRKTLSRYAVFLVGLRRTLRGAVRDRGPQEAMLREFLGEVEEALADALAARRDGRA
jgi:hypothetical protein